MDAAPDPPIERLRIERRGGLAGLRPSAECAYSALTAAQRQALHHVLASRAPAPCAPGADRYSYRLQVVQAGGGACTLELSEDALPAALAALVRPALP